jgi:purine catabolism regulator
VKDAVLSCLVPASQVEQLTVRLVALSCRCGVSAPVSRDAVPAAVTQAAAHLTIARAARREVVRPGDARQLGPLSLSTPVQAEAARQLLAPLGEDRRGQMLRASVRVWLESGGRWEPAAESLGVHRHTLRHRVESAFTRLGRNIDSQADRFEIWYAIELAP